VNSFFRTACLHGS